MGFARHGSVTQQLGVAKAHATQDKAKRSLVALPQSLAKKISLRIPSANGAGFQPSFCLGSDTWANGPGWYGNAPLALRDRTGPTSPGIGQRVELGGKHLKSEISDLE